MSVPILLFPFLSAYLFFLFGMPPASLITVTPTYGTIIFIRRFISNLIDPAYLSTIYHPGDIITLSRKDDCCIFCTPVDHYSIAIYLALTIDSRYQYLSLPSPILPPLKYQRYTHKNIYDNTQPRRVDKGRQTTSQMGPFEAMLLLSIHRQLCSMHHWIHIDIEHYHLPLPPTNIRRGSLTHRPENPTMTVFLSQKLLHRQYLRTRVLFPPQILPSLPPPTDVLLRR